MTRERKKDAAWTIHPQSNGNYSYESAQLVVLMDIRDELKQLNRVFQCHNFLRIPFKLDRISRNTAKPRKRKRKA